MQVKTKDIIKILPFDDAFRQELLGKYDTLDQDQKFNIVQFLWEAYDALCELKVQENYQRALLDIKNTGEKLDKDFYKRVRQRTLDEMQSEKVQNVEQVDLDAARRAMELIVKEIQANKKVKVKQ